MVINYLLNGMILQVVSHERHLKLGFLLIHGFYHTDGCPGQEVIGSMVIGSMGYIPNRSHL